ncbi:hypothetical protein L7F22_063894 [Adiantum nelumboides]|nr:hypothetical protein [Adiantum nelumboides]
MTPKKSAKGGKRSISALPSRRNTRSSNAMPEPPPPMQTELQEVEAPLDKVQEQEIRTPPPTTMELAVSEKISWQSTAGEGISRGNRCREAPTEKKLKSNVIWAASIINVLLDLYEHKWITINRGNFKAKHWVEVARDLNARCGTEFSETQCKYKWENMKRTFIKEKQKKEKSGAEFSQWKFFSRMADLIGGTPKVRGLQDGFNGEQFVAPDVVSLAEEEEGAPAEVIEAVDETAPQVPFSVSDSSKVVDGTQGPPISGTVRGQKCKKRKREMVLDGLGVAMKESVATFARAFESAEIRHMELEEKRMQVQLQIAQLLAPRQSTPSNHPDSM